MEAFLFQALIYLGAAVIAVPIAARLGLGSVLGYLAAGIVIGPVLNIVGNEAQNLQHFAEFGVVMMLFLIGLELEPRALWAMRHKLLGLGGLQITATTGLIMGGGIVLGLHWTVALAIGMAFALSSTAIVLQTLSEKGLMQTGGGRAAFSVLLTQDVAVIPMLALLPLLAAPVLPGAEHAAAEAAHGNGHELASTLRAQMQALPGWGAALLTLGAIAAIILSGIYLTRPVFSYIHHTHLREMYTALALLIVASIACLMILVGISPALGSFLAGVVLANSEFRHELESDLQPFKGLLLGLFFITVGAGINFTTFLDAPLQILGLTLIIMITKGVVLFALTLIFRVRGRDRWLFTLGLAQAGEFGFVLFGFALQRNVLPEDLARVLYLITALSMLFTPLFFILYDQLSKRMATGGEAGTDDDIAAQGPIIIAGVGRFGQVVNRMVRMGGFHTTLLDQNLNTVRLMRRFGFSGFLGDPTRPELLHAAGLESARVLVVTMDDRQACTKIVTYARKIRPDLHIIARAYDRIHVYELYQAGANDIVRELFDSSLRAGRYVIENMGLTEYEAAEMEKQFYTLDRRAMLELAQLWQPGVPLTENEAYVSRAMELDSELATALSTELDDEGVPADGSQPQPGHERTLPT
ncbi:MAG: cation:proton antiporter [Qingshengfaniella sp.]